ncbi:MAG: DNA topoisomerase IB [Devosia sp.]|uniref:DNA topoisomerase IB n=1 Tax=Devosia sp. TaxID=1871048 RepID=UPI001A0242F8|nr:DNA topoisomerase IB [Devosia sp.]MBF0678840.1 DNA topoisomerase IB [Devosia sp.]
MITDVVPPEELIYSSDSEPGWRRIRRGDHFAYLDAAGKALKAMDRQRIEALVIPPAWTEVWICPDPDGHLQATGRDERGRKQYLYDPRWTQHRSETKFGSLLSFARVLPSIREQVEADLRRRRTDLPHVAASVVWLLDNSLIRIGNSRYAKENKSFGLTTLRNRHVEIAGKAVRFRFKGKSGKQWKLELTDRRISRIVSNLQDLPGQHLFQYEDEEGVHPITSRDVNAYISERAGGTFSSKHFRTWSATVGAYDLLSQMERAETKTGRARQVNEVLDTICQRLGNTRAVCRSGYVHPRVIADWEEGRLIRPKGVRTKPFLDRDELETLAYLKGIEANDQ